MSALYRRHGGLVYRFTLQMSRDVAVAEEITQEVFLALLTQIGRFDAGRGTLSTWLCGIARRNSPFARGMASNVLTDIPPGKYDLLCRSIDANGMAQPLPRPFLKAGGNAIHKLPLTVEDA
jgi:hypothetical protein